MKYIIFLLTLATLQNCKGQDENPKKEKKSKQLEIIEVNEKICGKNSSSQKDLSVAENWKLSEKKVEDILNNSEKINEHDLHYAYGNLPCEIEAKIKINGKIKTMLINAGGYYYLDNKIYGCKSQKCYQYFPKEAQENDDADDFKFKSNTTSKLVDKKWDGNYSLSIDYGKLDEFTEISIEYDIEIKNNTCSFSGMGYKTDFTDQCKMEEKNNIIILKYEKNIEGDGFSDHSKIDTLGIIMAKGNKYYIKSLIVADEKWNYNKELKLTKK